MRSLLLLAAACALPTTPTADAKKPAGKPLPAEATACFAEVDAALADDKMDGRGTGTAGNDAAAAAIAEWLDGAGIAAPKSGRMQPFEARKGVSLGTNNKLGSAVLGTDFTPLGFSKSAPFAGDVVFAGYGIRAKDLGYDDYAGLDVKGKVVLAMRYEPGESDEKSPFDGKKASRYSDLRTKAIVAREAGAAALVLVSPTSCRPSRRWAPCRTPGSPSSRSPAPRPTRGSRPAAPRSPRRRRRSTAATSPPPRRSPA